LLRVELAYGQRVYISKRHYDKGSALIPICLPSGARRMFTQAGEKDGYNMLLRSNIARVISEKQIKD